MYNKPTNKTKKLWLKIIMVLVHMRTLLAWIHKEVLRELKGHRGCFRKQGSLRIRNHKRELNCPNKKWRWLRIGDRSYLFCRNLPGRRLAKRNPMMLPAINLIRLTRISLREVGEGSYKMLRRSMTTIWGLSPLNSIGRVVEVMELFIPTISDKR